MTRWVALLLVGGCSASPKADPCTEAAVGAILVRYEPEIAKCPKVGECPAKEAAKKEVTELCP